jgi:CTP synthase (UTP-ammonia lyase)
VFWFPVALVREAWKENWRRSVTRGKMASPILASVTNVCGVKDATSREWAEPRKGVVNFVIDFMEEQRGLTQKGGTMRLGSYSCHLQSGSLAQSIYGENQIFERHRHRYEFNNKFRGLFEKKGMVLSGICRERDLVEILELKDHPWFIAVQFHPEFKSRPLHPHPLFTQFVRASLQRRLSSQAQRKGPRVETSEMKTSRRSQKTGLEWEKRGASRSL